MLTKKKVRNNTVKDDEPIQRLIGRKWKNITLLIPGDQGCQFESPNKKEIEKNQIKKYESIQNVLLTTISNNNLKD
jgi:hypothetical protein